jgi:hypothetical protein
VIKKIIATMAILSSLSFAADCICEEKKEEPKLPRWESKGVSQFQFSQTHFSNWSAGGESALSWAALANIDVGYHAERYSWLNDLDGFYGRTKVGDNASEKTQDEVSIKSLFEYKYGIWANPFISTHFQSQFTPGYNVVEDQKTRVSGFMDPGYLTESLGWGIKPVKEVNLRFGGAIKQTWALASTGYADDASTAKIETFKNEFGAEIDLSSNYSFDKIFNWTLTYYNFFNFEGVKEVDTSIKNTFTAQLKEWLTVSFYHEFLYDYDQDESYQTQSNFSLNLMYSIF